MTTPQEVAEAVLAAIQNRFEGWLSPDDFVDAKAIISKVVAQHDAVDLEETRNKYRGAVEEAKGHSDRSNALSALLREILPLLDELALDSLASGRRGGLERALELLVKAKELGFLLTPLPQNEPAPAVDRAPPVGS